MTFTIIYARLSKILHKQDMTVCLILVLFPVSPSRVQIMMNCVTYISQYLYSTTLRSS